MRGRKATPTALKRLRGNPGKRALAAHEPQVASALPDPPDELDAVARAEWFRVGALLRAAHVVSRLDRAILAAYCQAWSHWLSAETRLREQGLVITAGPLNLPQLNPYLTVVNKAMDQVRQFSVELGLTPSARTRIHAIKAPTAKSKWQGILVSNNQEQAS